MWTVKKIPGWSGWALSFALLVAGNGARGADAWPATADAELQAMIEGAGYGADERRNVMTVLTLLAEPKGFDTPNRQRYFCESYHTKGLRPYFVLDRAYGKADGFTPQSLQDPVRHVKNVLAKGDRLWLYVETTARHTGRLYGVAGTGKPITLYETMWLRFDDAGKVCESNTITQQGELYRQLGGQMTFPGKPAASQQK